MHGSFSRADTANAMAAIGPDFKRGFIDTAPVSNADVGRTVAHLAGLTDLLKAMQPGSLEGRVMREALTGGLMPSVQTGVEQSKPAGGLTTVIEYQQVGDSRYYDAAGFVGRTAGLSVVPAVPKSSPRRARQSSSTTP